MAIEIRVGETITVETNALDQVGAVAHETAVSWFALKEPTPTTSSVVAPSITTDVAGCLIVLIGHFAGSVTAGVFSGAEPPVEQLDDNTTLGLDASIFADSFVQSVAGAIAARTSGVSGAGRSMAATLAFLSSGSAPVFGNLGVAAKVASGDLVPGEPSSSSVDDLFICILTQRDNVVATMDDNRIDPDQWTQIYGVDMCRIAGQESRASAWWCRRGTNPPDFTITRPGGNAGIAAVISFGNIFGSGTTFSPIHRAATKQKISVLLSGVLTDQLATVKGEFPGTDDSIVYNWTGPLGAAGQTVTPVTVLDANRIVFSVPSLLFDYDAGGTVDPIPVEAFGLDANAGSPPYYLHRIQWSMPGGVATFVGGINTGPSVEIAAAAVGNTTITVTAINSQGQALTAQLDVAVRGAISVSVTRVVPAP
jgi:hypothetical protein